MRGRWFGWPIVFIFECHTKAKLEYTLDLQKDDNSPPSDQGLHEHSIPSRALPRRLVLLPFSATRIFMKGQFAYSQCEEAVKRNGKHC